MYKAIFFDLDGTLLPMDQELFVKSYMGKLAKKMAGHGYDPDALLKGIWAGTKAMILNDGAQVNEAAFWKVCNSLLGRDVKKDEGLFLEFYQNDFQQVKDDCGFDPRAAQAIRQIKEMGYLVVLATNPLFPAIATQSRARWAGLDLEDFQLITTYENSHYCKPNPDYYREILEKLKLKPEECVMVGNDVSEDMVAATLGMQVFLLTDCIINRENKDLSLYPHGSFPELLDFVRNL